MAKTWAEFRHNFARFRNFRLYQHESVFSICMTTGKIESQLDDTRRWLTGDRKHAFARDIANSNGRETWRYDLTREQAKKELQLWRQRCSREGQDQVIVIEDRN